jgi:hypothetical protein
MADKDITVSPYLMRPLRTLEQVLGGRSRAIEPGPERVEGRQPRNGRNALRDMAHKEPVPLRPTD